MGIIKFFKELTKQNIVKEIDKLKAQDAAYIIMNVDQLQELSDVELLSAAIARVENKVSSCSDLASGIRDLSKIQRIVYAVYKLEEEVYSGGLNQFFTNASRAAAPYISESLGKIGAFEHQKLFDDFTGKYKIDLNRPDSFDGDIFDQYNNTFYDLMPPSDYLREYVKEYIDQL